MSLLDEECRFPKGTDDTFLSKINDSLGSMETYVKPKTLKGVFGIKHYAGEVIYDVKGFLEKNKDNVADEVNELFLSSKVRRIDPLSLLLLNKLYSPNLSKKSLIPLFKGYPDQVQVIQVQLKDLVDLVKHLLEKRVVL